MKPGDKKFIVVWENPRRIAEVEYLFIKKGFRRLKSLSDGKEYWRKDHAIFNTRTRVNKYLEIEDYRSIH